MDILIDSESTWVPEHSTLIHGQRDYYHQLLTCMGYADTAPPMADLLRRYYELDGTWLVVSPIHWEATHREASIKSVDTLSEQESHLFLNALTPFVHEAGMELFYHTPQCWLLRCDGKPTISAKPVSLLQHGCIFPELSKMDSTLFWQRFLTESQMFLSTQSLNQGRPELEVVNGLWVWGQGTLGLPSTKHVVCNGSHAMKLARLLTCHVEDNASPHVFLNNSLYLFNQLSEKKCRALQTTLRKYTMHWYWNNMSYVIRPKRWFLPFKRIWS